MKSTKKIALFDPYLDTLGGGEKHILSILSVFGRCGFEIDLLWDDKSILSELTKRFDISTSSFSLKSNFLKHGVMEKISRTHLYDILFYMTDGSYFFSTAKKNYIFCMYPEKKLYNINIFNKAKLVNFQFFANSAFTAKYIKKWTGRPVGVIYPYVDEVYYTQSKKEAIILSVGRFFEHLHTKRHDIIITAFKRLKEKEKQARAYKLIIAGSLKKEEEKSLEKLKQIAGSDDSISFVINPNYKELVSLYHSAHIYWHAAGYEINQQKEPYKVEHLGLTPLEALGAGCVTFAHNSGGPKETIPQGAGVLYNDIEELVGKTVDIIINNEKSQNLREKGQRYIRDTFSYDVFSKKVINYFEL